jgi:HK97 family phage portal protein
MNPLRRAAQRLEQKQYTTAQLLPAHRSGQPIFKDWDADKAISDGFRASEVVYRCIQIRAKAIASLGWYVETVDAEGEWERLPYAKSPIEQLLRRPNPFMSGQTLWTRLIQHRDLDGNALWTKIRLGDGPPVELWPVQTRPLTPIPTRSMFIARYEYRDSEEPKYLEAKNVVHFMEPDPENPYWGMPPLRSVARSVDTMVEAIRWNKATLSNRAIPELAFHTDQPLNMEEWEQARNEVALNYSGVDNARMPIVTGGGMEATIINWKPAEMDFINSLHHYREAIANTYGVPLPVLGVMRDATLANLGESRKQMWEDTLIPLADDLKGDLNLQLLPEFYDPDKYRICYDTSSVQVLREDFGSKCDQYAKLVESGVSPNAARKRLEMDLDDEEGGDTSFIKATLVPLAMAGDLAAESLRATQAGTENTEAQTETTLNPPKDPNKPKPAAA